MSTDGCSVWSLVNKEFSDGGCLAQDPSNSDVVYAGATYYNSTTYKYSMAVLKTTNGGVNWAIRSFQGLEGITVRLVRPSR